MNSIYLRLNTNKTLINYYIVINHPQVKQIFDSISCIVTQFVWQEQIIRYVNDFESPYHQHR